MYDFASDAVKRALPTARMGGPHTAGTGKSYDNFLRHVLRETNFATGKTGAPLDFVAFHAKGLPKVANGVVQMGMGIHLRRITDGFKVLAAYPELKNILVVIGESDPEGCAACGMQTNPENAYRNGTMYSSYTAASIAREHDLVEETGVLGAFRMTVAVRLGDDLLRKAVRNLAVLRYIAAAIPAGDRWHPVFSRYTKQLAAQVDALGYDATLVKPSADDSGLQDGRDEPKERCTTGKVRKVFYDCLGSFTGFAPDTCKKRYGFETCEPGIERVVLDACRNNSTLKVTMDGKRTIGLDERDVRPFLPLNPPVQATRFQARVGIDTLIV